MRNSVLNAIAKLNNNVAMLNKAEANEIRNSLIEINNEKIAQLNKLLDCEFAKVSVLSGNRYYMNNEEQFLTVKDNHYLILGYANIKFKIYVKDGIIKSVIPCHRLDNENLTMFASAPKEYSNLKELNEQELLEFVLNHTSAEFEVIEE